MSDTEAKKNSIEHTGNRLAFPEEIEGIYNALAGDTKTGSLDESRDIFFKRGMLEWLRAVGVKLIHTTATGQIFRVKPVEETGHDDLIILFANMMGGMSYGL